MVIYLKWYVFPCPESLVAQIEFVQKTFARVVQIFYMLTSFVYYKKKTFSKAEVSQFANTLVTTCLQRNGI